MKTGVFGSDRERRTLFDAAHGEKVILESFGKVWKVETRKARFGEFWIVLDSESPARGEIVSFRKCPQVGRKRNAGNLE